MIGYTIFSNKHKKFSRTEWVATAEMGKKLYSTKKWKKRVSKAQSRELRKREKKRSLPIDVTGKLRRPFKYLRPPVRFSLIHYPLDAIRFLNELTRVLPRYRLFVDFSHVVEITPDAALALVATLKKARKRSVRGSIPTEEPAKSILKQSGFFDHVRHSVELNDTSTGVLSRYSSDKVDSANAQKLIQRGTEMAFGKPMNSEAAYLVLLEGMENTVAHAHFIAGSPETEEDDREHWWAMVYPDVERKRVCFALVDLGVGILKSASVKRLRKLGTILKTSSRTSIVEDMFAGKLISRTGLENRGKGLPAIRSLSDSSNIKELTLVTNTVWARVGEKRYDSVDQGFNGTLLYWEIENG